MGMIAKPWTMGFTGALPVDLAKWVDQQIPEEAERICVPFLGSARAVSLFARPNRYIEAWDTQYLLTCVIEGVWKQKKPDLRIGEKPFLKKGYVYNERPYKGIPDKAAGLIDWIAENSSLYEKAALATAIIRCTYRGRIHEWSESADEHKLWENFQKRLEYQKDFLNVPGAIDFHQANFYHSDLSEKVYDVIYIDPPKIVSSTDAYSSVWIKLNLSLGVHPDEFTEFDRWTMYDYMGRMRLLIEKINAPKIVFIYTSDVRPNLDEIQMFLSRYGTLKKETRVKHRSRLDYGMVYDRF